MNEDKQEVKQKIKEEIKEQSIDGEENSPISVSHVSAVQKSSEGLKSSTSHNAELSEISNTKNLISVPS